MTNLWQFSISNIHLIGWIAPLMLIMYVCIYKINLKLLIILSLITTLFLISLGAYVRLTDAGLGCPDWPGCYGFAIFPMTEAEIAQANELYPERKFEIEKAIPEVVHRYFAGFLGLLIIGIFIMSLLFETLQFVSNKVNGSLSCFGLVSVNFWILDGKLEAVATGRNDAFVGRVCDHNSLISHLYEAERFRYWIQ